MAVIGASPTNISKVRLAQQSGKPTAPAAGFWLLWVESDGLHILDSADSESIIGVGAGAGVAADAIWDAAGDLAVGTGSNTAAKLAMGTAYQVPRVKSDLSTLEYASPYGYLIARTVLTDAAASIDFQNIPATFENLVLTILGRGDTNASNVAVNLTFNNDSGNNYHNERMQAYSNQTPQSFFALSGANAYCGALAALTATANFPGQITVRIHGYARTVFYKSFTGEGILWTDENGAGPANYRQSTSGLWKSTTAINRVTILAGAGNFIAGTVATLYGLDGA